MTSSPVKLIALAAAVCMVTATVPVAAANGLAVSTGNASHVTARTATVSGTLTDAGTAGSVNVSFEYWKQGDMENSSTTQNQTVSTTGEFNATLTGLTPNTTYEFRALASAGDETVEGEVAFFTTEETHGMSNPFGLRVVRFLSNLGGDDLVGPAVSAWVTAHNPGSDNKPAHAGPDERVMTAILGNNGDGNGAADPGAKGNGPPASAGHQADDRPADDEEHDGGPPEDKGNGNGPKGPGHDDTSEEAEETEADDEDDEP